MSFWQVIWVVIVAFAFICYLMILWSILTDLFRDSNTSGWKKAAWVVLLFFIPLLTSLVYLILKGEGMARRQRAAVAAAQQARQDYIRDVAGGRSPAQEIADAKALLESGTITPSEFDAIKAKALA